VLAGLTSAACTAGGGAPQPSEDPGSPDAVVAALVAGLAKRDVSAVPFAGASGAQVNAQLTPLVAGMGSLKPAVTAGTVDRSGSQATAKLSYVWTFPGVPRKWTYETTAQLVKEGGDWKATWQPSSLQPDLNGTNRLSERREGAQRGEVLGADGEAIVQLRPVVRVGIDKTRVPASAAAGSAARLAKLVGIDGKEYAARVAAAGSSDYVEAITFRASAERPSNAAISAIPGAVPMPGDAMLAPTRTFARAVLGTVGSASKEIVDDSSGAVTAGDQVGLSGLQRRYDEQLRGTPGVLVRVVPGPSSSSASPSPSGDPTASPTPGGTSTPAPPRTVFQSEAVAGKDLSTALSVPLQTLAEKTLASTKPASAIVAIQPSTGKVLAAANGPGSDLSVATVGRYPPGSTFKVVSTLALLRAGLKPSSPVTCPPTVTVNGKKFKNYSDYPSSQLGDIDLQTALAQSCNTAFIGQRGELSGTGLADAAASLGVGTDYDVGFSSFFGSVPADPSTTGRAAAMIGQGKVLASPLAMAAVAASVQAGRTVVPQLVAGKTAAAKAKPLTKAEATDLRSMMAAVVSRGSGKVLRSVGGAQVIAKTGTAEYGTQTPHPTHAWMIAAQGDLAVAVFVETGSSGSHTAGPLLATFLKGAQ
jgi:cell division protein FtsI/penicillin-binding protein 2